MKTNKILMTMALIGQLVVQASAQGARQQIAVVSIDTKGLSIDNEMMSGIVRLELEKIDRYEVLDKYDVTDIITANQIDPETCFGKSKVVQAGNFLSTDKMLTGNVEKISGKIIIIFRLIDVASERIEKTSVMEFLDIQDEIQTMTLITLNELLEIPNDPHLVDLLISYNLPITSTKTTLSLSGPRIGFSYTTGLTGERMQAPKDQGGYNMFPVTSMFGYQFEQQYLSSGDFQALIEGIVAINGLESGAFVPSIALLNGFRFNGSGLEIGIGPNFRVVKTAMGYFDENNEWIRGDVPDGSDFEQEELLDNRGNLKLSVGLLIAVGKTFRSGYLNVPVNVYFMPRKNGSVIGLTFGFNTTKRPKL